MGVHPIDQLLATAARDFPGLWKAVDRVLRDAPDSRREQAAPALLPDMVWYTLMRDANKALPNDYVMGAVTTVQAVGTWRYTKGIYQFDNALAEALFTSTLSPEIPADVFKRLPHWSIYIPLNSPSLVASVKGATVRPKGVFAYLDYCVYSNRPALQLVFMSSIDPPYFPEEATLSYRFWLDKSVEYMSDAANVEAGNERISDEFLNRIIAPVLNLILYICSDAPEIENRAYPEQRPSNPTYKKTKKGWRLFAAPSITTWDVGTLVGRTLNQADSTPTSRTQTGRKAPRPHVRRGHWHGYWVGEKDNKNFTLKWLKPTVISG